MSEQSQERITELYEGAIGTPTEQRLVAARIHWMISQVEGPEVLDVGCGQGIATLLLAREGRRAVGIDREADAIEWARGRAGQEPEAVRRRLVYDVAEATSLPFQDSSFDAVLLGAILEEQVDPGQVVREALRVLKPGGRLAITSLYAELRAPPFGEPLYLQGLIGLLAERIDVQDMALLDRYLAVAGVATPGGAPKPAAATWLAALEIAERNLARLLDGSLHTRAELAQAYAELEQAQAGVEQAQAEVARAQADAADARAESTEVRAETQRRLDQLSAELMGARERLARAEAELEPARREAEESRRRLEIAERELSAQQAAAGRASQDLAALQAERTALVREATEAAGQATRLQDALAIERAAASEARMEAAQAKVDAQSAHQELAAKDAAIDRLKETASEQAERITSLTGRLAAAEARGGRDAPGAVVPAGAAPEPTVPEATVRVRRRPRQEPAPRVLHLLARSLPHAQCPIALDRHGLLLAQRRAGFDSSAMTDLDFPWDVGVLDPPSCEFIDGIAYYRLHNPEELSSEDRLASATRIGEQLLAIVEPQILHAASLDVAPLALSLARTHSLRSVVELANDLPADETLDVDLLASADQVVALSAQQRDRAVQAGLPDDLVSVVPAFVDTTRFAARARPRRNGAHPPVVGVVAYQPDSPAVDALRAAISGAEQPLRGAVARVAAPGGEPVATGDEDLTETLLAAGEIPAWLGRLDVVIAATPHEALDAMAAGRPVVGVGAARDLAPSIDDLPKLLEDRRLRSARGAAARKSIEAHNTTAAVEAYARLYAVGGA
jgi:SAM-dependent methyltransferase